MNPTETNTPKNESERGHSKLGVAGLVTALGLTALGFAPRSNEAQAPAPESFTDQVQESAQQSYNPETDKLVIDGITISPADTTIDTPSEAVLANPDVQTYIANNPDETASLETSSMSLPSTESSTYAVVERDVDADGDTDAVAVPVIK